MHRRIAILMAMLAAPAAFAGRQEAITDLYQSINTTQLDAHAALLEKAVSEDPNLFIARNNYGAALYRQGQIDKAIEQLTAAEKLVPRYADTQYLLACCYAREGDTAKAMKHLRKAASAGFNEREMIQGDSDLDPLRGMKGFRSVEARVPRARLGSSAGPHGRTTHHHGRSKHHHRTASAGSPPPGHETQVAPGAPPVKHAVPPAKGPKPAAPKKPKGK